MPFRRIRAVRAGLVRVRDFKFGESAEVPGHVSIPNRNYMNLLELPILFYVVGLMYFVASRVSTVVLILSWAYVAARCVHSAIHLTQQRPPPVGCLCRKQLHSYRAVGPLLCLPVIPERGPGRRADNDVLGDEHITVTVHLTRMRSGRETQGQRVQFDGLRPDPRKAALVQPRFAEGNALRPQLASSLAVIPLGLCEQMRSSERDFHHNAPRWTDTVTLAAILRLNTDSTRSG